MRILVIGGCGFIGSYVTDTLRLAGHQVSVIDKKAEPFRDPLDGVEYIFGSFDDPSVLAEALVNIDAVLHLASSTVPYTSNLDPIYDISTNLIGAVKLLEAMRKGNVPRLVYLSSGGTVYGPPSTLLVREDHARRPLNSYGIVKAAIENYIHMENALNGLSYCVLRASNPYGPRQGHTGVQGIIGTYLWKLARGEEIEVWGDGTVVRDFMYVQDLADLCLQAAVSPTDGVFNAGSGLGYSVNEIIATIEAVTGRRISPVYKPSRSFDVPRIVLDIESAKKTFSWSPRTALADGIAHAWDWVCRQT